MTDQQHGARPRPHQLRRTARSTCGSFAKSIGYSRAMLARPVIGVAQSQSGFNNGCIAGTRIEPPMSLPTSSGVRPAASAPTRLPCCRRASAPDPRD
jgi:hypothetical protein